MKSIGERIKDARKSAGLTQLELAKKTELSRSYIGDIEKDRYNPSVSTLQLIATATNTPLENLLPSSKTASSTGRGVRIPVLGRVVAGIPLEAVEEILDYEEITPELATTGDFFALKIRGHSMEPRMLDGDVVIVRRQDDVDSGDVAIVLVNGNEATVKRIKKQEDGITLMCYNHQKCYILIKNAQNSHF
jgi:repressor LexA